MGSQCSAGRDQVWIVYLHCTASAYEFRTRIRVLQHKEKHLPEANPQ